MKVIKHDLGGDIDWVDIIPFSDSHIGEENCNIKEIEKTVEYIKTHENTYTILNGDMLNIALKTSVSDVYSETMTVQKQLDYLVELFQPIKDKILAILSGNHEDRIYLLTGLDIVKNFAYRLGLINRYCTGSYLIFVSFGQAVKTRPNRRYTYSIYGMHGSSGGRSVGGKLNQVKSMGDIVDADIYLHSHTHLPAIFKDNFFRTDMRTKSIKEITRMYINTNAFLNYGGYGEIKGYTPANRDIVKIKLRDNGFTAEL